MESTIRISASGERRPTGGLVGALVGGSDPGTETVIEVDLREASGVDVTTSISLVAEAYRLAHFGERSSEAIIEVPFPEAGDDHPFPESVTPEESQPGTLTDTEREADKNAAEARKAIRKETKRRAKRQDRARELIQSVLDSTSLDDPSPITTNRIHQALVREGLI